MKNSQIPNELQELVQDIAGARIKITNNTLSNKIAFGLVSREHTNYERKRVDERLEYIIRLILNGFFYRSVLMPFMPVYVLGKEDISNPSIWNRMIADLENDFLGRIDVISRGNFSKEEIYKILSEEFLDYLSRDDSNRVDVEKMYMLTLFIYDYVQFTFNEMALSQHIKFDQVVTSVEINGEILPSTGLLDDILVEYITQPYDFVHRDEDDSWYRVFKDGSLYVPAELKIEQHPNCNVNNMTALFYDLFKKFFVSMNLTKRKGATLSELETNLIAKLAKACGICNTDKGTSVAAMYKQHKDYFIDCELYSYVRENQYARLMLNNCDKLMFSELIQEADI